MSGDVSAVDSGKTLATPGAVRSPFETLLEPVLDGAFAIALRYTRNRSDAEDLVQ